MVTVLRRTCRYFRLRSCQTQVILCMSTRGPCQVRVNRSYWGTNDGWCHFSCLADWRLSSRLSFQIFLRLYIWTHTVTVRSALLAFSLYPRLAVYIYIEISAPTLCLPLPPSLTVPACLSVSLCLSLSPWPVWSVIEGAVFTWPTGMEGTLCALWRQIALLAPRSLYLSFTSLLLPSSNHAHTLTTLLVSPLYHHSPLPSHPSSLSY